MTAQLPEEVEVGALWATLEQAADLAGLAVFVSRIDPPPPAVLYASRRLAALVDRGEPEQLVGMLPWMILRREDHPTIAAMVARPAGAPPAAAEVQIERPDGRLIPILLTTTRLVTSRATLTFGYVRDLSQQRATEAVAKLAAEVAHDINNPLTYVQLTAHRLDRTLAARVPADVAATVRDQLADIRHGLERIAAITARLRSLSRADEPAPAAEPAPPPSPAPAEAARHRVLVIDDEPLVRGVLAKLLADTHAVTPCASGPDGLALLATARFDVILCDVMMPGMNGRDVYQRIATEFPGLEQRVVFISGGTFAPDLEAFLDTLPNAKIAKPFRLDEVLAIVERVANSPSR